MDRVADVGPHAPVEVLGGVHHPLAPFRRLPLGHGHARRPASRPVSRRQAACHRVTRMASMSMAASAARSMVPWKVLSGRPNWCARSGRRRSGAAPPRSHPDLQGAQRRWWPPRASRSGRPRPRPAPTRTSSARHRAPRRGAGGGGSRGWWSSARSSEAPARVGSTRARTTPPSGWAGTTMPAATWAWGTASSVPCEAPARRPRRRHGRPAAAWRCSAHAGQGRGEDDVAGRHPGQPRAFGPASRSGPDRQRAEHQRGPQRAPGPRRSPCGLEQQARAR